MFTRDLSAARETLRGRSQTIHTSFGSLEYAVVGSGDPILVIHGAGGGFDQGLDMTASLARRGYRLVAPSRFGYLGSALPASATTSMQADAYAALLDHLGISKAAVLAISAGEWSALQFALRHPQRCTALVLVGPPGQLPPGQSNHGGLFVRWMTSSDFAAWLSIKVMTIVPGTFTGALLGTDSSLVRAADEQERARLQWILRGLLPMKPRADGMRFDIQTARSPGSLALNRIDCPVLTISAADDRFGTAARAIDLARRVRHGSAVIYPNGGHALVGRQIDLLRDIESFLRLPAHLPR